MQFSTHHARIPSSWPGCSGLAISTPARNALAPVLTRFVLYALISAGSWAGGAFVERLILTLFL